MQHVNTCECGAELPPKRTRPRLYCDDCKRKRKAESSQGKAWNGTDRVVCADCGLWFNRSVVSAETVCSPCRRGEKPPHGRNNTYARGCRCPECSDASKVRRQRYGPKPEPQQELICETCGESFVGMRRRKYCSEKCWIKSPPGYQKYIKGDYRKRARRFGVDYEPLDRNAIFGRDNWTCGICKEPVDPELSYPDRMSASLDHVVPLSKGGSHVESNVQCAHWECNILKRDNEAA